MLNMLSIIAGEFIPWKEECIRSKTPYDYARLLLLCNRIGNSVLQCYEGLCCRC